MSILAIHIYVFFCIVVVTITLTVFIIRKFNLSERPTVKYYKPRPDDRYLGLNPDSGHVCLSQRDTEIFLKMISDEKSNIPNDKLREAFNRYKKQVIQSKITR